VSAHGIRLDPATREVTVDGAAVELALREFAVLERLLTAAPAVVSKEELLDAVWGDAAEGINVVEVYVGYLRRKLGRERIETVRGVGYRIAP
jgi:DNA-binding response OmpR family regulator